MTRPNRFPGAARRAALLVATTSALTIACLAPPTGTGVLLVTPPAASVGVGDAVRLTALPQDDGSAPARAPAVTWTSSDTSVATVDATGLVTGVAPGSAIITATTGDQSGSAQIIVSAHPPGTVEDLSAAGTTYSFELVAFRGTLNGIAVFGELSNIATGVTAASTAPVASVSIAPHNGWVLVGGTLQLVAILKDAKGNLLTGRTVTWT